MSIKQKLQFIRLLLRDFQKQSAKKKQKKLPLTLEPEKLTSQIAETRTLWSTKKWTQNYL